MSTVTLTHNRVSLALHELRPASTSHRPLLLLHGLGECTPATVPDDLESWTGAIWGLDFTGHGESTIPVGGGYTAEVLIGDVDAALNHLGEATIIGRGLGGYLALLAAGARPRAVQGAIITDGPGLSGGPNDAIAPQVVRLVDDRRAPDSYALHELSRDVRSAEYAVDFVRMAVANSGLAEPINVAAVFRPPWLDAVAAAPGVASMCLADALDFYRA